MNLKAYKAGQDLICSISAVSCSVMSNLCDPMACSTPGLPVHHQLPELVQTHVHQPRDDGGW